MSHNESFVSVLIPTWNEEARIDACLQSILQNDYPATQMEILVVDGQSSDETRKRVKDWGERDARVRLLDNPQRIQAAALNRGLAEARGEIVIRMDAHARYASDYVFQCVRKLQQAQCVGGPQRAVGSCFFSQAVADVMATRFAAGGARYRFAQAECFVDTVFLGAWKKKDLEAIGGFDDSFAVNEDYECHFRLRQQGGKILLSPSIRVEYEPRKSLGSLCRQYFRYGYWKVKTLRRHPSSWQWRQVLPPLLVLGLVASAVMSWWLHPLFAAFIVFYLLVNMCFSAALALKLGKWRAWPFYVSIYAAMHMSWGLGFWMGLLRFGFRGD